MKGLFWVFIVTVVLSGCYQPGSDVSILSGSFIGYYHQNSSDTLPVRLSLKENTFVRNSDKSLPATCSGTFKPSRETILFIENCNSPEAKPHFRNLNGLYSYRMHDDGTLAIWKKDSKANEEYILKQCIQKDK